MGVIMKDKILTIDEVAEYLKIPKPTLYYLAQEEKIPAFKVGKHWRFEKQRIDAWIKKQHEKKMR